MRGRELLSSLKERDRVIPKERRRAGQQGAVLGERTVQQARNLALTLGQQFEDIKFPIRDRGSSFTASFDADFPATGTRILVSAVHAPPVNAICERLAGTLRREIPGRTLIPGEAHLRAVPTEYQTHYNTARPHQGTAQHVPGSGRHIPAPP